MSIDDDARRRIDSGDATGAAELLFRAHGAEIFAFLRARMPTVADAEDTLQAWCEDVLRGLPSFRSEASVRTWAFQLARNRAAKMLRDQPHLNGRLVDGGTDAARAVAWEIRTRTAPHQDTGVKSEMRALLATLDADDQEIIALHAGLRAAPNAPADELTFNEIAALLADAPLAPDEVKRHAARHRKRHERAVARLRELWSAARKA